MTLSNVSSECWMWRSTTGAGATHTHTYTDTYANRCKHTHTQVFSWFLTSDLCPLSSCGCVSYLWFRQRCSGPAVLHSGPSARPGSSSQELTRSPGSCSSPPPAPQWQQCHLPTPSYPAPAAAAGSSPSDLQGAPRSGAARQGRRGRGRGLGGLLAPALGAGQEVDTMKRRPSCDERRKSKKKRKNPTCPDEGL